ncbi:MAG: DUF4360 domain-containing protein [Bdellovibrionales bacterium]|jgi:hypothetical protein|nr:DUF4360 domain-containing protein [Bdellovibrionales bacterium]
MDKSLGNATKLIILLLFLSFAVYADDIFLGVPGYGGNGCPAGSASVTLSPDAKSLSIIFDEFITETNRRKPIDRKSCNLAIPVHVPQGLSVSIIDIDYRGFVSLPSRSFARIKSEYFFAGSKGPILRKLFKGKVEKDFLLSASLAMSSLVWSACGEDVNLRVNTSLFLKSKKEALAALDSVDMNAGLVYHLKWRRCH